jgi:hypothetical protein
MYDVCIYDVCIYDVCMYVHMSICMYVCIVEYCIEVKYWSCAGHLHDCRQCNYITDNSNKMTIHMTIRSNNNTQHSGQWKMTTPSHLSRA